MSIEGLWTVRFASVAGETVQRESGGVVTLNAGRILGGDTWAYFHGDYELDGKQMKLRVDVAVHYTEGGESIFGGALAPYKLLGAAEVNDDATQINASLHIEGLESAMLIAILTKVSGLT